MATCDSEQEPPVEDDAEPTAEATEDDQHDPTQTEEQAAADLGEDPVETLESAPPTSTLSHAITELVTDGAKLKDRLLRTAADFENYRKRARKDLNDRVKQAEERVFLDVLSVADNLERAMSHATEAEGEAVALKDGVEMVYKQFLATLDRYNIRPIKAVGQSFNPERHEAIQQIYSDEELGTVTFEMRKGYMRGDRLVRASMVVVSKGPAPVEEEAPEEAPPEPADEVEDIVVTEDMEDGALSEQEEDAALADGDETDEGSKPADPEAN